jgi:hypothetical protein
MWQISCWEQLQKMSQLFFEVQQNDKILSRKILDLSQEQCRQSIPVNESAQGQLCCELHLRKDETAVTRFRGL